MNTPAPVLWLRVAARLAIGIPVAFGVAAVPVIGLGLPRRSGL